MSRSSLLLALLALGMCAVAGALPGWYNCNPTNCLPPSCRCASTSPPDGLAPADTPQFIMITHDDSINPLSEKLMRSISDKHTNPNGCNVPVTWYAIQVTTECANAKRLWEQNHEIALHTVNHTNLGAPFKGNLKKEMLGVRDWLNQTCGIPFTDLVGYRNPYLVHNPATRAVQKEAGLLYDSTMISVFAEFSEVSKTGAERVFPFTMVQGIPIDCNWDEEFSSCNQTVEKYPGLWEVPLYELQNATGGHLYSMDVGANPPGDIFAILKENFLMNYNGNHAPFGIYLHSTWFDEAGKNAAALNKFMEWAMAQPNVWAVTTKDVVRWMQDPVPASQMAEWLKCNPVDLTATAFTAVKCQLYTVQSQDTSYAIATAFAVTLDEFVELNKAEIGNGAALTAGQQVKIPQWDATCVGDAIKPVTGPGQVILTPAAPDATTETYPYPGAHTGTAPVGDGIAIKMTMQGRPVFAFKTDLKTPFVNEVARALNVTPAAVTMENITPLNAVAGRRLFQAVPVELPIVVADLSVSSSDPAALETAANTVFQVGSTFDTQVLPLYQLKLVENAQISIYGAPAAAVAPVQPVAIPESLPAATITTPGSETGVPADATAIAAPAPEDSGSSGLSTGVIIGIACGGAAVLLAILIGTFMVVKNRRSKVTIPTASPVTTASASFTTANSKFGSKKQQTKDDLMNDPLYGEENA